MSKYWDLENLLATADAFDVARSIGIPEKRSGSTTFIQCVFGTHSESHLNHMKLFKDGCKCYSCGASCNTYGMVKEYYANVIGMSLSHDDICTIIADTCGGAQQFIIRDNTDDSQKKSAFPLSPEELEAIGLRTKSSRIRQIIGYQEDKDEEHREPIDPLGYAKTAALPAENIYSLYREEKDAFWCIVESKVAETLAVAKEGYSEVAGKNDDISLEIAKYYRNRYNTALGIVKKYFPKKITA